MLVKCHCIFVFSPISKYFVYFTALSSLDFENLSLKDALNHFGEVQMKALN